VTVPADHRFLERLLRVEECLLAGRLVDADAAPEALAIIRAYRTGKSADEVLGFEDCQRGDRKEPHSIEYMLERLNSTVQRMEHAADRAERAAEHLVRQAAQKPGDPAPQDGHAVPAVSEMTTRQAAELIGVNPQTIRNWLHLNPYIGTYVDGRWRIFPAELANYYRARFPDAAGKKFGV
jgi:hypothetical protein